ncbi:MAG TPA: ABC transporter permease [Aggregatilineales bacterium]|nr:ABC transporter permease [Aggregatilineales bacterium]
MKAVQRIFVYELMRQGKRRAYLLITLGVPVLMFLLFLLGRVVLQMNASSFTEPSVRTSANKDNIDFSSRPVGVVDESGMTDGVTFPGQLKAFKTEQEALDAVHNRDIASYYVIPSNYGDSGEIFLYFDRFSLVSLQTDAIKNLLIEGLLRGHSVDPNVVRRLQRDPVLFSHTVNPAGSERATGSGDVSFVLAYAFDMTLMFSAFMTSGYLMQSIVEEKASRMIEIMLSSVRPVEILAGKILAFGLLGLIQIVIWGLALVVIIGQLPSMLPQMLGLTPPTASQVVLLLIYFILGYLLLATCYASIGALSNNMREGPQLAAVFAIPIAVPLYFLSVISNTPGGALAVGLSLFPFTAPTAMISRVSVAEVPLAEIVLSIALLLVAIAGAVWVAARLFRVTMLLSGQMPRLSDLPRLIRDGA